MEIKCCRDENINCAADLLKNGGVVVIPTDTVYGLAALPSNAEAVAKLYTIKDRKASKPIALLASSVDDIEKFGAKMPEKAKKLAADFWPGALTLVFDCEDGSVEGFRIPSHNLTQKLISLCGGVLRVTSANVSGSSPATDIPMALESIGLKADLILDDGVSPIGVASTVVRVFADNSFEVLRKGAIEI
jgi:L-threonylcarbamoyladenylate synthase